ncbi:MAG: DUF4065 domain-containing protein [Cytophagales bacterium]|nr:MAG: DUF4065 domain-containing protein [Cytophagales bacterium]
MVGFNHKKAVQTLTYFAQKEGGEINKMKAFKLIWLSDRLHLRKYGRPILNDVYFALPKGPIPSNTKDLADTERELREQMLENSGCYALKSKAETQKNVFSQSDLEVMGLIYENFGNLDKFTLSELSHEYPEWKKFEKSLQIGHSSHFEMNYQDFFEDNENSHS